MIDVLNLNTSKTISILSFICYLIIGFLLLLVSCSKSGTNPEDQVFELPDSNLTFVDDIQPLFISKCSSRTGCHLPPEPKRGLDLRNYDAIKLHLVDNIVPLVISGNGEGSFLYQILQGPLLSSRQMPLDSPLLNENNKNGIKTWIDEELTFDSE